MPAAFVLRLVACFGQATLVLVSLRASGPLALPLTLMSTDLLIWNFASFAYGTSGWIFWQVLNCCTSPFTSTFGFHFILVFVGRRRSLSRLLVATYVVSAALSSAWLVSYCASRAAPRWRFLSHLVITERLWSGSFLAAVVVVIVVSIVLLTVHLQAVVSVDERQRTRVLVAALPAAAVLGATGLDPPVRPRGAQGPRSVGTLLCAMLMSIVALRLRLFGRRIGGKTTALAVAGALLGVAAYCVVLRVFTARTAVLLGGVVALVVILAACARRLMERMAARQVRREKLGVAARVWAQLSHDLKNPLAALQGAIQFLKEERRQGRSMDAHAAFLDLIGDQIQRMVGIVDGYNHVDGADPTGDRVDLAQLLREVGELSRHAGTRVTVRTQVPESLPPYVGDRELLARVLQNLVSNALEAMPEGGELVLSAAPTPGEAGAAGAIVTITDTGEGMDARTRERAFDDFFTTKARGTGLGLAFVRRVVEARGGRVTLKSAVGRGTTVSLLLPLS